MSGGQQPSQPFLGGMSRTDFEQVMQGVTSVMSNAVNAAKSSQSGPKIEMKPLKVDENEKILDCLELVKSQATLFGYGDAFDENVMRPLLPLKESDIDSMDPNVPAERIIIEAVKANKKAIALLTSLFTMPQHADLINKSRSNQYPIGIAYLAYALLKKRALPQSENAKLVLDAKMMNLQVKEQEDPKVLENNLNKLKKEYALCDLPFPEQQLVTILKSQLMRMKGTPYGTTLKEAESNKKLSVNETYMYALADAQAALSSGTAGKVVLPTRPTGAQLETSSDDIITQMKSDFEKACVLEPSKFKLLGSATTSKTTPSKPKEEVALIETSKPAVSYNCSKCGQPGHKGRDCPNKGGNNNNNKFTYGGRGNGGGRGGQGRGGSGRGSGPSKPKFNGNCNKCGKFGHMAKDCWAKEGEVANVEVVLAALSTDEQDPNAAAIAAGGETEGAVAAALTAEDVFRWMAEDEMHLSINDSDVEDPSDYDLDVPRVLSSEREVAIHALRHMEQARCLACLGRTIVRNMHDAHMLNSFCPTCKYTTSIALTSPWDLQCFYDPIEPDDADTCVSRPVPNKKRGVNSETAQEHEGTELKMAETEIPSMYRTDVTCAESLSLVDERWNQRDSETHIPTELLELLKNDARFKAVLTEILVYLGRDLTPSWMVDNERPTQDEYIGWVRTLKASAEKIGIDLDENWILACLTIGQDTKIFPDGASPCKCTLCWSPGRRVADTKARCVVTPAAPTHQIDQFRSESSSENDDSSHENDDDKRLWDME